MKILIVTQYFWPETFKINDLCLALKERGHDVTIYTGLPNYPQGSFFKGYSFKGPYRETFQGMDVYRIPLWPRGGKKGFSLILNYVSYFIMASLLAPLVSSKKYDQIFIYQLSPITVAIPGIVLKYLKRIPLTLWVTDLWPESLEATGVVKNKKLLSLVGVMVKWIYKNSDKILITSKGFKKAIETFSINPEKIEYWPQWAENIFYNKTIIAPKEKSKLFDNGFNIVFAGNIGSAQDFETIIEAACKLKKFPDIRFIIIGDGIMKSWVDKKIQELDLNKTFYTIGKKPLEHMPYYFEKADALLLTLKKSFIFSITIPSKLQTYLASGKPIIVGIDGEASDIVQNWNSGVTAKAGNAESLKKAILKLYHADHKTLTSYGYNSRKCYQEEFHREALITKLEYIFQELS